MWLKQGCKPKTSSRRHQSTWEPLPAETDSPRVETEVTEHSPTNTPQQDSEEKVTPIQVDLSSEERQLLELGPKFALTRRVDETLMSSVRVEIAACAYRLRWVEFLKQTASCSTLYQHLRQDCQFQRPFAKAPPINNVEMEDSLKQLNNFVIELFQRAKVPFNLTPTEAKGLKLLKNRRSELHISVSDKGGEFVVMKRDDQKNLTTHHIDSTGVYQFLPPTRKQNGVLKPISTPTPTSYHRQIKSMTTLLEEKCNKLWSDICDKRQLGSDVKEYFKVHTTQLPTMYVLIKTHKFNISAITENSDLSRICKVRPIVSCCGSPTEKLAWICTKVLSSLLDHIPSHLRDTHSHLERLKQLSPGELRGHSFCSADVTSLYTNINIQGCIEDVINLAAEHLDSLQLFGLELVDVHEMLELVFTSSYFVFDRKLYQQMLGLFMGCKPSPIGAIVRVYTFERRSLYIDPHYLPTSSVYGRYVDDAGTIAKSEDQARNLFNRIADEDPDGHLGWEIDYPSSTDQFIPFLGTQIRISEEGGLESKYYRKEQKKQITLNFKSHHPMKTKVEVARNFYKTANISSSSPELTEESYKVVDRLLVNNGYPDPRQFLEFRMENSGVRLSAEQRSVTLKLPYMSEEISSKITKFIRRKKLPITVVFLPGIKLKDLFCSSRPHDKRHCTISSCQICPKITTERVDCSKICPIYRITCNLCCQFYVGESSRSLHERLGEHLRYASNPTCNSYKDEALAIHYKEHHPGLSPDLMFELLGTESNTIIRKVLEAHFIFTLKPEINNKEECTLLQRFLLQS